MADYIDPLEEFIPTTPREMAEQIRDEYVQGANTAKRVGDCILAMLDENERILEQTTHFMDDVRRDYAQFISEKSAEIATAIRNADNAAKEAKKQADSASGAAELARKNATNAASQASAAGAAAERANTAASRANAAAADAEKGREEWDAQKKDVQNGLAHLNQIGEEAQTTFEALQGEQRTAISQAQEATTAANSAATAAKVAAKDAEKVNAQLNGTIVTITSRNGVSKSVDLGDNVRIVDLMYSMSSAEMDFAHPFLTKYEELFSTAHTDTQDGFRIDRFVGKNEFLYAVIEPSIGLVGWVENNTYAHAWKLYNEDMSEVSSVWNKPLSYWKEEIGKYFKDDALRPADIVDNLTTEDPAKALSAKQGKVLDGKIAGKADKSTTYTKDEVDAKVAEAKDSRVDGLVTDMNKAKEDISNLEAEKVGKGDIAPQLTSGFALAISSLDSEEGKSTDILVGRPIIGTADLITSGVPMGSRAQKSELHVDKVAGGVVGGNQMCKPIQQGNWKAYNENNTKVTFEGNVIKAEIAKKGSYVYVNMVQEGVRKNGILGHTYIAMASVKSTSKWVVNINADGAELVTQSKGNGTWETPIVISKASRTTIYTSVIPVEAQEGDVVYVKDASMVDLDAIFPTDRTFVTSLKAGDAPKVFSRLGIISLDIPLD